MDDGVATPDNPVYPTLRELPLPQTNVTLSNFGGRSCGGTLAQSFTVSCNTTFAQIGLQLGDSFVPGMARFGVGTDPPPLDIAPGAASSVGPPEGSFQDNQPLFAQAGIGQGDVATTPLQMALVAASVADGGIIMEPHVGAEIRDASDDLVRRIDDQEWKTAMSATSAQALNSMMISVVDRGSGTSARIAGISVAGKTGTAQADGGPPHAWFIAFAPANDPKIAVAVLVERGGSLGNEATGGAVAAPIAARMIRVALGI
jgi:peptidoglycan glycosyltransferase